MYNVEHQIMAPKLCDATWYRGFGNLASLVHIIFFFGVESILYTCIMDSLSKYMYTYGKPYYPARLVN